MPVFQHVEKQIHLKIVYYGPGLGGKTTNLRFLHAASRPEMRGKLISLATESERTLFFDLLPVELGVFRGYRVRLHLCTVPGQIAFESTRRLVLHNVDGIVFVVDSQAEAMSSNLESIRDLQRNLVLQNEDPARIPLVVQYNKRDLPGILDVAQLRSALGIPADTVQIEACARSGVGVPQTLKSIVKECLRLVGDPSSAPEGRTPSVLPGVRASMFPGSSPSPTPHFPRPPRVPTNSRRHLPPTRSEALPPIEKTQGLASVRTA